MSVLGCPECGKSLELGHDCLAEPTETRVAATLREDDIAQIRRTLGALASAVKCGEAWTPSLSVEFQLAQASIRSLENPADVKPLTDKGIIPKVMTGGT